MKWFVQQKCDSRWIKIIQQIVYFRSFDVFHLIKKKQQPIRMTKKPVHLSQTQQLKSNNNKNFVIV